MALPLSLSASQKVKMNIEIKGRTRQGNSYDVMQTLSPTLYRGIHIVPLVTSSILNTRCLFVLTTSCNLAPRKRKGTGNQVEATGVRGDPAQCNGTSIALIAITSQLLSAN